MDAFISVPENVSNIEMEKARKSFGDLAKQIMFALVRIFGISRLRLYTDQKIVLVMVLKKLSCKKEGELCSFLVIYL